MKLSNAERIRTEPDLSKIKRGPASRPPYSFGRSRVHLSTTSVSQKQVIIIIIIIIKAVARRIPSRRPQMRYLAVIKCWCLYTMYHINNNAFRCVLKVVRLQSDIRNAVGELFHTEGPAILVTY